MHDQACRCRAKDTFHNATVGGSGNDNLVSFFSDGGLVQQVGDIAMLDDTPGAEPFSFQRFDRRVYQPGCRGFDFFFATLVSNGVFFSGLKRIR